MHARTVLRLVSVFIFVGVANASYCEIIHQKYSPPRRLVTQHGVPKNITLYYDSDAGRAAAAILYVVLQYALGYQQLFLRPTPNNIRSEEICYNTGPFKEVNITVSAPSNKPLLVYFAKPYRDVYNRCSGLYYTGYYKNEDTARECGFVVPPKTKYKFEVYIITDESYRNMQQMYLPCIVKCNSTARFKTMSRLKLLQKLRKDDESFSFVDYHMWSETPDVEVAEIPNCLYETHCFIETNIVKLLHGHAVKTITGNNCLIKQYAPQIFEITDKYAPTLVSLKPLLEITTIINKDIVESTCEWVSQNYDIIDSLTAKYKPTNINHTIISIACNDTSDLRRVELYLDSDRQKPNNSGFNIVIQRFDVDCTDLVAVWGAINDFKSHDINAGIIGIVTGKVINIENVINIAKLSDIPVILYDSTDIDAVTIKALTTDEYSTDKYNVIPIWLSTGQPLHLTISLKVFLHQMGWTRIAIITDQTSSAKFFKNNLISLGGITIGEYSLSSNYTDEEAENVLHLIKVDNGRIVFVNTDYHKAVNILGAAVKLKMNIKEEYAWVTRDWQTTDIALDLTHFVISFSCKNSSDVPSTLGNIDHRYKLDEIFSYKLWSSQTAAFANAVLTLVYGFDEFFLKYPEARDDKQSNQVIRQLEKHLAEIQVKGVTQTLKYKKHMLEEVVVFIEQWQNGKRQLLKQLRVNSTDRRVTVDNETEIAYEGSKPPNDFQSKCICQVGDPYKPTCLDSLLFICIAFIGFVIALLLWKRITRPRRRKRVYTPISTNSDSSTNSSEQDLIPLSTM